ncbi:MAG: DciA family protein [Thermoleophilia bacterium]
MGAAEMLGRFRRRSGGPPAGAAGAVAEAWRAVVGAAVADHTAPLRRSRAGVLTVACSSAAWAQELTMRRDELVGLLARAAPDAGVTGLRFSVADHVPAAEPPPPPPPPAPVPGARERAFGDGAAEGIADPAVRDLVARAAAAAEARRIQGK